MRILFFRSPSGASPVEKYLDGLSGDEAAMVFAAILSIEEHGLVDAPVDRRPIGGKLWELKVSRQRVFYVVITGPAMVLLHAYKKQGQKAPPREIEIAKKRMREVLQAG